MRAALHDLRGRRLGAWDLGPLPATDAAPHAWHWDGRDDDGRPVPSGAYWILLDVDRDGAGPGPTGPGATRADDASATAGHRVARRVTIVR